MATTEKLTHVSEINKLVLLGKEKGYLTYEEVNDVLPSDVVTPEQIDDLMHLFGENEIDIVDTSLKGEKIAATKGDRDKDDNDATNTPASKSDSVSIDDSTPIASDTITCSASGSDIDGDSLNFTLSLIHI